MTRSSIIVARPPVLLTPAVVALIVFLTACGSGTETGVTTSSATAVTSSPVPRVTGSIQWGDQTKVMELGDGWEIAACEGDAPMLCVSREGRVAGVIEGSRFPVDSFEVFEPDAPDLENLRTMAADFIASLRADRAKGCPSGYAVEELPPSVLSLWGAEVLRYGFIGTNLDGSPSELSLQYATIDRDDVVLIAAPASDDGGCPGPGDLVEFDSRTLAALQPRLEAALEHIPLPPSRG